MTPHKAIAEVLRNDVAVSALVGSRIKPLSLSQGLAMPYIAYTNISDVPEHSTLGPLGYAESRIQIESWDNSYDDAKDLADAVRKGLDGYSGTIVGIEIQGVRRELSTDIPAVNVAGKGSPSFHGVSADYLVQYQEDIS